MSNLKPRLSRQRPAGRLAILLGAWAVEVILAGPDAPRLRGTASFRWLAKDAVMVMRSRVCGGPPTSLSAIGADDSNNSYCMLYSDERGVVRHYDMLTRRAWTLKRRAPGFSQRFVGRFARDRRSIRGAWEKLPDGRRWQHAFELVYTKKRSN